MTEYANKLDQSNVTHAILLMKGVTHGFYSKSSICFIRPMFRRLIFYIMYAMCILNARIGSIM